MTLYAASENKDKFSDMPIFSIVMPVYNTGELARAAILSVVNQSFTSFELIIIDDGSTDNSWDICKDMSMTDHRIRIFNKDNEGQGVARNVGIDLSIGRYLIFLDSDDVLYPGLLEKVWTELSLSQADAVSFGIEHRDSNNKIVSKRTVEHSFLQRGSDIFEDAMLDKNFLTSPCTKAYNLSLIKERNIKFPKIRAYEDTLFSRHFAYYANEVIYIKNIFYCALIRPGSTTRKFSIRNFEIAKELILLEEKLFKEKLKENRQVNLFRAHVIKFFSHLLILAAFRINDRDERIACLEIANSCGFSRYAKQIGVLRLLSKANIMHVILSNRTDVVRFIARQAQRFGINPY